MTQQSPVKETPAANSPTPAQKGKVEKLQSYMGLASTTLGVLGAVGTAAVWLITTYYGGYLELRPDKPVEMLTVTVYDSKGQPSNFYAPKFQLFPGSYHLEVAYPNGDKQHFDTTIKFAETSTINLIVPEGAEKEKPRPKEERKWWQFWRR